MPPLAYASLLRRHGEEGKCRLPVLLLLRWAARQHLLQGEVVVLAQLSATEAREQMTRLLQCAPVANKAGADAEGSKVPRREAIAEQRAAAKGKEVSVIEMITRDLVVQPLRPGARRADVILEKAAAFDRCAWHGSAHFGHGPELQNPESRIIVGQNYEKIPKFTCPL